MLLSWELLGPPGCCIVAGENGGTIASSKNVGAISFTRSSSIPFLNDWSLPFPSGETLSGYEDVVSSCQDRYTTWVQTDPDVTSERHMVDVQKGRRTTGIQILDAAKKAQLKKQIAGKNTRYHFAGGG